MNIPHPLSDIASLYQHHKQLFQNSVATVASERKGQSLAQKIYDYLTETSSEQEMAKFSGSFARMEKEARNRVDQWVDNNVVQKLKESGEFTSWIKNGEDRFKTQQFAEKVNSAIRLGEEAILALDAARDACRYARNMEVVDAVSTNKSIAVASSLANQSAKGFLSKSENCVNAYLAEFSDDGVQNVKPQAGGIDADLVVDLFLPDVADLFSMSNMFTFAEKALSCDKAKESIIQSIQPLYAVRDILLKEEKLLANAMDTETNRVRDQLQQTIPNELNDVINPNNQIEFKSHIDPKVIDEINSLTSNVSLNEFVKSTLKTETEKENKNQPLEPSM